MHLGHLTPSINILHSVTKVSRKRGRHHMASVITSPSYTEVVQIEGNDFPIIFIEEVPKIKYHEAPFHFMSESGMSQGEYQQAAVSNRYEH